MKVISLHNQQKAAALIGAVYDAIIDAFNMKETDFDDSWFEDEMSDTSDILRDTYTLASVETPTQTFFALVKQSRDGQFLQVLQVSVDSAEIRRAYDQRLYN